MTFSFEPSLFWFQVDSRFHFSQNKLITRPTLPQSEIIKFSAFRLFIYFTFIRGQNLENILAPSTRFLGEIARNACGWYEMIRKLMLLLFVHKLSPESILFSHKNNRKLVVI